MLSEQIVSDGKPVTVKVTSETVEAAFATAAAKVPNDARVVGKRELQQPEVRIVRLSADDEDSARKQAKSQVDKTTIVKNVTLAVPGRKGFLGIGRTQNQYDIEVVKQAVVELTYKTDARIVVVIGDQAANWPSLLSVLGETEDPVSATELFSQFPYQILFALLKGKIDDPAYFDDIPFVPITNDIIARAKRYIEHPPAPGLLSLLGRDLPSDRYVIMSDGKIGRKSDLMIDTYIFQVAGCLRGRGTFSMHDTEGIAKAAYDAIIHYSDIPIVYYFFSLPYFETVIPTKELLPNEPLITVYKGVEGLLLEMYDELSEGQIITDDRVKNKVKQLLK